MTAERKPKISVIIPTFDRAPVLARAINSVLSQTYQDFEVIVVDDCSHDTIATKQVIDRFLDNRIKYIRHASNGGGSAARNTGIRAANGDYIAFLDDDDEWNPEKLEKQLQVFQKSGDTLLGAVYSGFTYISLNNNVQLETLPRFRGDVFKTMLQFCILGSATPLVLKDAFLKTGLFDETLSSCQDWDMWIRLSRYFTFEFVPESLAKAYIHGDQISTSLERKIKGRLRLLEKNIDDLSKYPSILALHLERLGLLYILAEHRGEGINYLRNAVKADKKCLKGYVHLLLSLFSPKLHKRLIHRFSIFTFGGKRFYY
jgi:glycosyltransferase involved in cell wall biosynthesis